MVLSAMLEQDIVDAGVDQVAVAFDVQADSLSMGVGCDTVCGGEQRKRVTRDVSIALDLGNSTSAEPDGQLDVIVARSAVTGKLGLYRLARNSTDLSFGEEDLVPATIIDRNPMPNSAQPDVELTIEKFDAVRQSAFEASNEEYVSLKSQDTFTIGVAPLKSKVDPANSMKVTVTVMPAQATLQAKFLARIPTTTTTMETATLTTTTSNDESSSSTTNDLIATSTSSGNTTPDKISSASQCSASIVLFALLLWSLFCF